MQRFPVAVVVLLFSAAWQSPGLCQTPAPTWPAERWPVSSPQEEGIDPAAIEALVSDMQAGKYGLLDHFLLIRHGRVVADHHFEHDYEKIAAQYDSKNHQYNYDHPDCQWWVPHHENGKTKIFSGSGYGGQFPIVVPEYDLVVVFNAWNIHGRTELSSQAAVRQRILPAIAEAAVK